ncbi:cell surface protein Mas1 [Aspergillus nomiae NRRL 13137]|uniref:Cell surface protein Mas1 n=1 Tax=Aspergillus nomiae NRRL (strain ATCC 15546 / NRRL 13137 / CBS 260.88 / M93) TaxID=1509407 RepID=A0A0L1JHN6_ASPN3|nr:cell surface protein Mas1 [Aspergillus nomiae NRRL 13137]KNG91271.1 cell surface protein Mas1 [Aspergillus nomiae NRRL 13137]
MLFIKAIALTGLAVSQVSAHGLITRVKGHNGIDMPGLTIQDGVPRDCPSAACGAQKDTAIIRDAEFGSVKASPLGRTLGGGPVNPATVINNFVSGGTQKRSRIPASHRRRQLINDAASIVTNAGGTVLNGIQDLADATPFGGTIKSIQSTIDDAMAILPGTQSGTVTGKGAKENGMQMYSGKGASIGLPTASPDGVVTMIFHQVNQDGAGPLSAEIDPSSGGTDPKAFKSARVIQNIPGVAGFSTSSTMDYAVKVQVPQGMKCTATVGGAKNVCIVRVRNNAISGPFGGSAAFTQEQS